MIFRSKQQGINQQDLVNAGVSLTAEDFEVSLNKTRMKLADSIGAPKVFHLIFVSIFL